MDTTSVLVMTDEIANVVVYIGQNCEGEYLIEIWTIDGTRLAYSSISKATYRTLSRMSQFKTEEWGGRLG
jgi:hypothetical protein